ncbi:MAG: nicotinate (nicotinamide) nucleotide adenylyltransferase [Treponema sp.]|nr:nicotinate (nicotinamide) nucleotide adenylyltransferase [Treponema sp.]
MKIAVLGGSFNPLHNGHVMIARSVCEDLGYDKVLFVPAFIPPHKQINCNVSAFERLQMVSEFCKSEENGRFVCESCEIERGGISYTCDTLKYLSEKYRDILEGKLAFILGEESAAEFHKWKNPEKIAELSDIVIARRGNPNKMKIVNGFESANLPTGNFTGDFSVEFNAESFGFPFIELKNSLVLVSSSEIRNLISGGADWKPFVPSSVANYIEKNHLYS